MNFFQIRIADFRKFLRESAILFIILCSKFDNSIKLQQNKECIADLVQKKEIANLRFRLLLILIIHYFYGIQ